MNILIYLTWLAEADEGMSMRFSTETIFTEAMILTHSAHKSRAKDWEHLAAITTVRYTKTPVNSG